MTTPAIYVTRALTQDGTRITSRINLTLFARVLEARSHEHGLILGGWWYGKSHTSWRGG
jgi:hypothetical protein